MSPCHDAMPWLEVGMGLLAFETQKNDEDGDDRCCFVVASLSFFFVVVGSFGLVLVLVLFGFGWFGVS